MIRGVYIPSLDAKDAYLASASNPSVGYSAIKDGVWNTKRFTNTFDQSLDLMKLREVWFQIFRNRRLTFRQDSKEYCPYIVNVTFNYSVKLFNKMYPGVYARHGYYPEESDFVDGVAMQDGLLIGIKTKIPITDPVEEQLLEKCFTIEFDENIGHFYAPKTNMPILKNIKDLRYELYNQGFLFEGRKYVRFKRSAGSSRQGKCLFIDERLYQPMMTWSLCGLDITEGCGVDLAALESYLSLTTSSIIGTIKIRPDQILLIDDCEDSFEEEVIVTDSVDGKLRSYRDTRTLTNSLFDGESLIDSSLCPDHGAVVLRERMFKSCCFSTHIQKFFADHNITSVEQLNGQTRAKHIEDIKLITTKSSVKYTKFASFEQWLDNIEGVFGCVKHEHETAFFQGELVRIHYQLINSLQLSQEQVDALLAPSIEYLVALRSKPEVFRNHIHYPPDNDEFVATCQKDVVYNIMGISDEFCKTKLYYNFMTRTIRDYVKDLRKGHIRVKGNYAVLLGNGYEMLLQSIGQFDGKSTLPPNSIHHTKFEYGKTLVCSRSPHVCSGNILVATNVADERLDTYFNLTPEIVCISSVHCSILDRLSGADHDGDTMLISDNQILVDAALKNYEKFLVPVSAVVAKKTQRYYTNDQKADLDVKTAQNKIGEIINCAQLLNTLFFDRVNNGQSFEDNTELYEDIAKLSVMSGICIDLAKKEFDINLNAELKNLKNKYFPKVEGQKSVKPKFFKPVSQAKGYYNPEKNEYKFHDSSMDYVQHSLNKLRLYKPQEGENRSLADVFLQVPWDESKVNRFQIAGILKRLDQYNIQVAEWMSKSDDELPKFLKYQLKKEYENQLIAYFAKVKMNPNTVIGLLHRVDRLKDQKPMQILNCLFMSGNEVMRDLLEQQRRPVAILEQNPTGNIEYLGVRFKLMGSHE